MAVDRGGLIYRIELKDAFSKTAANFKQELGSIKKAFTAFQASASQQKASAQSFRGTTKAIDEQAVALKKLAAESKRQAQQEREVFRVSKTLNAEAVKRTKERLAAERQAAKDRARLLLEEQRQFKALIDQKNRTAKEAARLEQARRKDEARNLADQQRQLKNFADAQTKREKEAARISAAMKRDEAARKKLDPGVEAQRRVNQGLKEELVQRKQIALLRTRASTQFASGDFLGGAKTLRQAKDLERSLNTINKAGNNLFFTFRRLIGVLALFTIARNLVQGFNNLVTAGVEFNDKVTSATIGIAGLLVAVTDVRDALGQSVTPAEELELAMGAADDQIKKLRQDALRTVATFEQLLDTFQVAVAPGFAAGLNLDEIRKLTVSISQAATALGVQQDQLAEEIRSLLAGTISARTTRIATSLGITNEDIRRLKETGELFEFLEKEFEGFAVAAEKQARATLAGIGTLVQGAVEELLGEAAKPLFEELVKLGNEFFDLVLTVKDAEGNLKPNPEVVAGFREIFDALREGVLEIRAIGEDLGFEGLQNTFRAIGAGLVTGIKFALGFAQAFLVTINAIVEAVRSVGDFFGLTTRQLGQVAGALGVVVGSTVIWNNTLGLIGINFGAIRRIVLALIPGMGALQGAALGINAALKTTAIALAQIGAVVAVVIVGFDQLLGVLFDVNLSLSETTTLIGKGIAAQVKESIGGWKLLAKFIQSSVSGDTSEQTAEKLKVIADELRADELKFNQEVAAIIAKAAEREARGPGFDPSADFKKKLEAAKGVATDFKGIISAADAEIDAMAGTLFELQEQLFKIGQEFKQAFNSEDLQGAGAKIQDIFSESLVTSAEKLKQLKGASLKVETAIANLLEEQSISAERKAAIEKAASSDIKQRRQALKDLNLSEPEAQLVSLLRDEKDIREAIASFEATSLQVAFKKAAIVALEVSRELAREAVLLRSQVAAEQILTQVIAARLGHRRRATVEARNALDIAREEARVAEEALQKQIDFAKKKFATQTGVNAPTAAEREAFNQLIAALEERLELEQDISAEKIRQLNLTLQEAALIESGSLTQGLRRGFEELATELPTAFEAGVTIVKQSVTALADFISQSIVSAFDPTEDASLQERFARFLQGIAQIILQQIIQLGIAAAIQKSLQQASAATIEQTSAGSAALIRLKGAIAAGETEVFFAQAAATIRASTGGVLGSHKGGLVKGFAKGGPVERGRKAASRAHAYASGYAVGGPPAHVHPSDTIPAWLQPGEFVMRKSAVDRLGQDFFESVNRGRFAVASAAPPSGGQAASAAGMASGGLVSDQLQRQAVSTGGASRREGDLQVVPVQVAGERELDRILAGGRSAARQFLNDNAGIIRNIARGGK